MKKITFFLSISALLLWGATASLAAGNLVPNGDLETSGTSSTTPQGWNTDSWGTNAPVFTYPAPGMNGTRGAKVALTSYTSGDAKWYFNYIPVTPGATYQLSDNYNSNVVSEVDVDFLMSNGSDTYVYITNPPSSLGAWATFTGSVVAPSGAVSMTVLHLISSVGSLTIDNMSVTSGTTPPTPTCTLSANPANIQSGQSSTLTYSSTNATGGTIDNGVGAVGTSGTVSVSPTATTTYTGTFSGGGGTTTCAATVSVTQAPPPSKPVISSFSANPASITSGQSSTLSWSVTGATSLTIDQGVGTVTGTSKSVSPTATTTYTLTATNSVGTTTATVTVNVSPPSKPVISSFSANPTNITSGQSSTLSWSVTGATSLTIDQGVGTVTGTSKSVSPTATTTYTLTAQNSAGTTTATVTVNVAPLPPPSQPVINSFSANPASITSGQSSTLSWSVTGATSLTIDQGVGTVTGTSKSVSPTATTTYTLTATNSTGSVAASTTVAVAPIPPPPPGNLIQNGDFEIGTANNPQNWTCDFWGSLKVTCAYPVTGNGGGKAAKVTVTNWRSGDAKWDFPHVQASSHTIYQFSDDYQSNVYTNVTIEYTLASGAFDYEWIAEPPPTAGSAWGHQVVNITVPSNAVSFTVLHTLDKNGTLTIDNASLVAMPASPFAQGMVALTYDDGLLSQFQNAVPQLKADGVNASFFIITTEPTSGDSGYMTWPQITNLAGQGYEIGGHTRTHPFLTKLTALQAQNEIAGSFNDLVAQGFTPKTFVYPFGDENPTIEQMVKNAGYIGARASYFGINAPFANRWAAYDIRIDKTSTFAQIKSYIDQAIADKRLVIFELHDVLASGGDDYSITPALHKQIVDYIKSSGIQAVTLTQAMQLMN